MAVAERVLTNSAGLMLAEIKLRHAYRALQRVRSAPHLEAIGHHLLMVIRERAGGVILGPAPRRAGTARWNMDELAWEVGGCHLPCVTVDARRADHERALCRTAYRLIREIINEPWAWPLLRLQLWAALLDVAQACKALLPYLPKGTTGLPEIKPFDRFSTYVVHTTPRAKAEAVAERVHKAGAIVVCTVDGGVRVEATCAQVAAIEGMPGVAAVEWVQSSDQSGQS